MLFLRWTDIMFSSSVSSKCAASSISSCPNIELNTELARLGPTRSDNELAWLGSARYPNEQACLAQLCPTRELARAACKPLPSSIAEDIARSSSPPPCARSIIHYLPGTALVICGARWTSSTSRRGLAASPTGTTNLRGWMVGEAGAKRI